MPVAKHIRNVAIIAHVDHGKTTLVDGLLKAGGAVEAHQELQERAMDSMDLEREKGITIRSKNTSVFWRDYTINVVDTPGHADFGAEVERVMRMVDGVLLVVDATDGPQAQTRFVLRKAIENGLSPVIVVNKIDREHSRPDEVVEDVLELLLDLGATEEQFESPVVYGSAKNGYFVKKIGDPEDGFDPLLETLVERVPPPTADVEAPFLMLASNISWDDYVGRIALGKIEAGVVEKGQSVYLLRKDGTKMRKKVSKIFEYSKLGAHEVSSAEAGNIVGIAGFEEVDIGETLAASDDAVAMDFIMIDPPTVQMQFAVNDGPFAGLDGKKVTSRAIYDRLVRETKTNISIEVGEQTEGGLFNVSARGAMQIAVLVETMRREGFEVLVSRPSVIMHEDENGKKVEPFETLFVEVLEEHVGGVMRSIAERKGQVESMEPNGSMTAIEATVPTRGLIGFEFELMNLTSGHGVMSHLFKEYAPHCGVIKARRNGSMVSMAQGTAMAYSLLPLEERGVLFASPGDEVYVGQLVGEHNRESDIPVNVIKAKALTNHRASGKDNNDGITPATKFTLERAIEYIGPDEFVEATPSNLRLRKRILDPTQRKRIEKSGGGFE